MKSVLYPLLRVIVSLSVGVFCGFYIGQTSSPSKVSNADHPNRRFSPDFGREVCILREVYEWQKSPDDASAMTWVTVEKKIDPLPAPNFYAIKEPPCETEKGDRKIEFFVEEDHLFQGPLHGLTENRTPDQMNRDPQPGDRRARDSIVIRRWIVPP